MGRRHRRPTRELFLVRQLFVRQYTCSDCKKPAMTDSDRGRPPRRCNGCQAQWNSRAYSRKRQPRVAGSCLDCKSEVARNPDTNRLPDYCVDCRHTRDREAHQRATRNWRGRNRELALARTKASRNRNETPADRRKYLLRWQYGLTPEQFDQMVLDQDGRCAICEAESILVVDHCHSRNRVRQLLCNLCNKMLGQAGDSIPVLHAAIAYLARHQGADAPDGTCRPTGQPPRQRAAPQGSSSASTSAR